MKRFFLCLLLPFLLLACDNNESSGEIFTQGKRTPLSILSQDGTQAEFQVELALTPAEQARGLMNRTKMGKNAGMLFFFGDEAERGFWMKNTLIPLDMIFIRADGTIHHIHENAVPHDLTSIPSQGPVAAVLELNGGRAKALGIHKGDRVYHMMFGNK